MIFLENLAINQEYILLISLFSLGLFGGFSHCVGMCSPFILTQINSRLENIEIAKYSNFQKVKNFALIPYHAGRIFTYSFLGFLSSFIVVNIQDFAQIQFLTSIFLFIGSFGFFLIFIERTFKRKILHKIQKKLSELFFKKFFGEKKLQKGQKTSGKKKKHNKNSARKNRVLGFLFKNPIGFKGFILGIILGFIPCGLLYSAFAISSTFENSFLAAFGMFIFGIATFPSLFTVAFGGYFLHKLETKFFTKIVNLIFLINAITLFLMAI